MSKVIVSRCKVGGRTRCKKFFFSDAKGSAIPMLGIYAWCGGYMFTTCSPHCPIAVHVFVSQLAVVGSTLPYNHEGWRARVEISLLGEIKFLLGPKDRAGYRFHYFKIINIKTFFRFLSFPTVYT